MKLSMGLRNHLLSGGSMRSALNGGVIRIYAGPEPAAAADAVPSDATMICEITDDNTGGGLEFASDASAGRLQKSPSQIWSGAATDSQQASWFRFERSSDDGAESTTALRMQGAVGTVGSDLNMSNTMFSEGAIQTIDYFSIFQPE